MTTVDPRLPQAVPGAPMSESDRRYERHNSIWYWLIYGVSAGLLALILGLAIAAVFLPRIVGAVPLTVLTESMSPAIPPGTLVVVRPIAQSELDQIRAGDVISFLPYAGDHTLVTHRVIRVTHLANGGYIFTTQGDANPLADTPVRGKQVRAKLWYSIPGVGWLNDLVNEHNNRTWIIPTVTALLFVYAGYTAVSSAAIYAKERRERTRAEKEEGQDAAEQHHGSGAP